MKVVGYASLTDHQIDGLLGCPRTGRLLGTTARGQSRERPATFYGVAGYMDYPVYDELVSA